jgi:UDP-N-acetylglucosamine/UDP-N-acetylgalactosamine 4-epimerase
MKYLVTGVAGFIGSHILDALLEQGHEVVGLDNFFTGHRRNIAHHEGEFEMIEGDIRDLETCKRAASGVDHVIHQAALGSVPRSVAEPLLSHEINTTGTLNMLVAARDANVSSFVFAASSSYFGDTEELPKHDNMPPRPLSPYAVTKVTCEQYLSVFAGVYGLNTVGLRYFNIFGPRQDPNGPYAAVIPKFVDAILDGQPPTIHGDGEQTRDFTYVANAVWANIEATKRAEACRGRVFNMACGDRISLNQLYDIIAEKLGSPLRPIHGPPRVGDIRDSLADISVARELLGYTPLVEVHEGLSRTVEWFVANRG